ncbi:MAG: hypothetical protein BJ554DRAFT_327, partial [Olpidium bornovanus]
IVIALIDRLAAYAAREAECEDSDQGQAEADKLRNGVSDMNYEIYRSAAPAARNGPGQHTTAINHNYNHWATTSRLAQGYYDRPQYTRPRGSGGLPAAGPIAGAAAARYCPSGVYTSKTYGPTTAAVESYAPSRSHTSSSGGGSGSAMAGVRSGPPYAPERYASPYTAAAAYDRPAGGAPAWTSVAGGRNFDARPATAPDKWPAHDLFRPTIGGGGGGGGRPRGISGTGASSGYLQGRIGPADIVPGAFGLTADRATAETADVYASELRPAVVYEKRIRRETEAIHVPGGGRRAPAFFARRRRQDVVDRNRYTTEIRQVIQPVKHTVDLPEKEEYKHLAVVSRSAAFNSAPNQIERYERQRNLYPSGSLISEGETTEKKTVYKEPIIRERIRARIIEEIQPLVYREVVQPVRVESKQPIYETVIHGATVRDISKAEPISFEEFERRGYSLEGRARQEKINGIAPRN